MCIICGTSDFKTKDKLEVVLGAHNISRKEQQQQRIKVQKHTLHPCYRRNERQNDVMLLKVQYFFKLAEH